MSICYFDILLNFSVIVSTYYKDLYVKSFFPCTVRLWNSVPVACFPLPYDLNGLNTSVNRHFLSLGFFYTAFVCVCSFFCSSFSWTSKPYIVNPNLRKIFVLCQDYFIWKSTFFFHELFFSHFLFSKKISYHTLMMWNVFVSKKIISKWIGKRCSPLKMVDA